MWVLLVVLTLSTPDGAATYRMVGRDTFKTQAACLAEGADVVTKLATDRGLRFTAVTMGCVLDPKGA